MISHNADSTSGREATVVAIPCGKALEQRHYLTRGGLRVQRSIHEVADGAEAVACLRRALDSRRGVLLSSTFEYPGRYRRYDIGFINPPVMITARAGVVEIRALNARGQILLPELQRALTGMVGVIAGAVIVLSTTVDSIQIATPEAGQDDGDFPEEQRSRQSGVFSVLRGLLAHFHSVEDGRLGLYGAFGYDLAFQFEAIQRHQQRDASLRDMVLYLPDEILVLDHYADSARLHRYDFVCRTAADLQDELPRCATTGGLRRHGSVTPFVPALHAPRDCDHQPGEYADTVRRAHEYFRRGDLFEVVPGQVFFEPCKDLPSQVFERLQASNPAPYGAMMNLGQDEYLLAASPEMYVRVEGRRVETCPISGTIARGGDAIADAQQIRNLLNSAKDEAELSMCTDVDRNDKSRVCEPGSVRVIGRRQVELYSRLIHTVDHVEGTLLPHCDALDAFLSHAWAVTVTGAPKQAAIQLIEQIEKSPRRWYGGAMGMIGFDGNMNTGLTLRAARISQGVAEVRAGATLLSDSDPLAEEAETRLKASAVLAAVRGAAPGASDAGTGRHSGASAPAGNQVVLRALMVDHRDSFVHTLAGYFRQQGVQLETRRPQAARTLLQNQDFDLVILSPGPGRPDDFGMRDTLALCEAREIPVFGVCLGLQGMVEHFGGELGVLAEPMHGKSSLVTHDGSELFRDIPVSFTGGRYHSLHALRLPDCLQATAVSGDGVVMAIRHRTLPMLGLQFHPESILSMEQEVGLRLVANAVQYALSRALPLSRMPRLEAEADPLPMQSATR